MGVLAAVAALCALPSIAGASMAKVASVSPNGIETFHFAAGPYTVTPGANLILTQANHVPKPNQNGFMIRFAPNLHYMLPNGKCCGKIPLTNVVHLHHGVWLSDGAAGRGEGNGYGPFYPFMASGEEKTVYSFPAGYGYPVAASDLWVLNYMLHNLTDVTKHVYITYNMEFIPESSPLAAHITPVHPIWMDVQDHHIYPVFNVLQHSGVNGKFTYPDMAKHPYGSAPPLNEFTIDHPGVLIGTAGHLHPGGLYDDLDLIRAEFPQTLLLGSGEHVWGATNEVLTAAAIRQAGLRASVPPPMETAGENRVGTLVRSSSDGPVEAAA